MQLHYNDIDKSLNEDVNDKVRKYHADYKNNPPNTVAFMPAIAVSGVQSPQSNLGATCFHFRHAAVLNQQVKMWTATRKGCFFTCYPQFGCRTYRISFSHSPITFTNISVINLVSIFRCSSFKTNSVYTRHVNSLVSIVLGCSLS